MVQCFWNCKYAIKLGLNCWFSGNGWWFIYATPTWTCNLTFNLFSKQLQPPPSPPVILSSILFSLNVLPVFWETAHTKQSY